MNRTFRTTPEHAGYGARIFMSDFHKELMNDVLLTLRLNAFVWPRNNT